jgi:hypothetical protein
MLSTSCLICIAFIGGTTCGATFVSLDMLSIKATNYIRNYKRKQSAKRLLALAFGAPDRNYPYSSYY